MQKNSYRPYNRTNKRRRKGKRYNQMKIFVTKECPTAYFYYKVLAFLLDNACRSEIDHYLDIIEKSRKTY